jgi:YD repeat-containing protein
MRLPCCVMPGQRVRKKVVTSTFTYDNNGNLSQKTVDGTSTTYVYDYANRLIALGAGGATTTYAYDLRIAEELVDLTHSFLRSSSNPRSAL